MDIATVHLPVDTDSVPFARGLCRRALVDRLDVGHEPDGRRRVTLEKHLAPRPPLRLVDSV